MIRLLTRTDLARMSPAMRRRRRETLTRYIAELERWHHWTYHIDHSIPRDRRGRFTTKEKTA